MCVNVYTSVSFTFIYMMRNNEWEKKYPEIVSFSRIRIDIHPKRPHFYFLFVGNMGILLKLNSNIFPEWLRVLPRATIDKWKCNDGQFECVYFYACVSAEHNYRSI